MTTVYILAIIIAILIIIFIVYQRKPGKKITMTTKSSPWDGVYPELPERDDDYVTYSASPPPPTRSSTPSKKSGYPQAPPAMPAPSGAIPPPLPGPAISYDEVSLALSGPGCVQPHQSFNIKFIAYPERDEQKVEGILKESDPDNKVLLGLDFCNWQKGTEIKVRLYGNQLMMQEKQLPGLCNTTKCPAIIEYGQ